MANKYLNLYNYRTSQTDYSQYIIGDATVETKEWNGNFSRFPESNYAVFARGGRYSDLTGSGVFAFYNLGGGAYYDRGFRPVFVCL